jgi:betaine-homocysteine S-methyltransferase
MMAENRLLAQLERNQCILCGEGYLFELERRGYVQIGPFVPEVVLNAPEAVKELHRELVRCGSDVVEAFTYYAHRTKLRLIGQEDQLEKLNRQAIQIAKQVAGEFPDSNLLVAANICNTTVFDPASLESQDLVRSMYEEQIQYAVEEQVDFVIAETFGYLSEAKIALQVIKSAELPVVVTMSIHRKPYTQEGVPIAQALNELKAAGADIVGVNCARGPQSMLELFEREIIGKVQPPLAALPVGYRTTRDKPTMQMLSSRTSLYSDLDCFQCTRQDFAAFAEKAFSLGIKYLGTCCGAGPHHLRAMAEALNRTTAASQFSPDLSKHFAFGSETGFFG